MKHGLGGKRGAEAGGKPEGFEFWFARSEGLGARRGVSEESELWRITKDSVRVNHC